MSDNKILPEACQHVVRGELKHLHTVEVQMVLTTTDKTDDDYRYGTGPDRMRLCALCTGIMLGSLLRREVVGLRDPLIRELA